VLDDVTLLLGSPVARGYGYHIAGAEGIVGIVDKEGLRIIEELLIRQPVQISASTRSPSRLRASTYLFQLAVPCLATNADLDRSLHQAGCHHHPVQLAK
jgi:hypothetical protein